jgi:hypothetical protein
VIYYETMDDPARRARLFAHTLHTLHNTDNPHNPHTPHTLHNPHDIDTPHNPHTPDTAHPNPHNPHAPVDSDHPYTYPPVYTCTHPHACIHALARCSLLDDTAMQLDAEGHLLCQPETITCTKAVLKSAAAQIKAGRPLLQPGFIRDFYPRTVAALRAGAAEGVRQPGVAADALVGLACWAVVDSTLGDPMQLMGQVGMGNKEG